MREGREEQSDKEEDEERERRIGEESRCL